MMRSSTVKRSNPGTDHRSAEPALLDDSSLINLYTLLLEWKWLFVLAAIVPPIIAGIFLSITQPVFESRAVVLIGEAIHAVEPPDLVAERLRETHGGHGGTGDVSRPVLHEIRTSRAAKSVMSIVAHGSDPAATREFVNALTEKLLAEHRAIMDVVEDRVRLRRAVVDRQIGELRERTAVLTRDAKGAKDGGLVAALVLEKSRVQSRLDDLEQERVKLDAELQNYALKSTRLLREADLPHEPVVPRVKLVVVLSLVIGLIAGAVGVLVVELLQRARRREG